jgi:hypothetical protein
MKLCLRNIQPQKTIAINFPLTLENLKALYPVAWNVKEDCSQNAARTLEFKCFYSGVAVTLFEFESGVDKSLYLVLECETDNFRTYQRVYRNSGKLPDLEETVKFIKEYQKTVDSFPSADNVLANLTTDDRFLAGVEFSLHSRTVKAEYVISLPGFSQSIETVSTSIGRICKRFDLNMINTEAEKIAERKKLDTEYYQARDKVRNQAVKIRGASLESCSNDSARFSVYIPVDRFDDFQAFLYTI